MNNEFFEDKLSYIEDSLVKEAMLYSLCAGGKRLRPKFLYAVMEGYQYESEATDDFACALEMIHTYSLIHDDLPAMDNDTYRRGNLTCHKKFDEATAILAGDALLTEAFTLCSKASCDDSKKVKIIEWFSKMSGANGMILGQNDDMQANESTDYESLKNLHMHKTGCLYTLPLIVGAILSEHEEDIDAWNNIGMKIGLAFQIQDDILDVTQSEEVLGKSTSDITNNKVSSVKLLGIENAEKEMQNLYDTAIESVNALKDFKGDTFISLIEEVRTRTY